jgi:RNA polymerase sporulation-specific sigma factor
MGNKSHIFLYKTCYTGNTVILGGIRMGPNIIPIYHETEPLKHEETVLLLQSAQNGCEDSRKKLIERNIKLVLNIAHRFKRYDIPMEDLFQIGSIGLIKSIDNFDLSRNVRFSTYAVPMILGEIRRFLRDNGTIKVSRSLKDLAKKISRCREEFIKTYGHEPRISDIAGLMNMEREEIVMAMEANTDVLSLQAPISNSDGGDDEISLEDCLSDYEKWEEQSDRKELLKSAFKGLEEKEKMILHLRYFQDKTQSEIGKKLGVSQAHVSRLEKLALKKLRATI